MHAIRTTCAIKLNAVALAGALTLTINTQAGEIGHFAPGVLNIRDFAMPEPGFYGVLYNYGYTTDRLNDSGGEFSAKDRFQGQSIGLNLAIKL